MSCCPVSAKPFRKNWAWLSRLKNSARNCRFASRKDKGKFLITEKSVFTKRGPYTGARGAVPSSPIEAFAKAHELNQFCRVWIFVGQPVLPPSSPARFGSPTKFGR